MQRFKSILIVIDSKTDNRVLRERAQALAQKNQARLTVITVVGMSLLDLPMPAIEPLPVGTQPDLIDVIEELPPKASETKTTKSPMSLVQQTKETDQEITVTAAPTISRIQQQIIEDSRLQVESFGEAIRQQGIEVSTKMLFGTPFLEITREVVRNQHDLVMITAEGNGGLREKLFGNMTMNLMRKCPCPVWVIKPTQFQSYNRIMAAVDPDPSDKIRNALNTQILELATSLAHQEQSELLIVHTWNVYGESTLRGGLVKMPAREVDKYVEETRGKHLRRLTALLEKHALADLKHQVYMLKGDADILIPELARRQVVDLIVMGTVCRTGVAGFVMGNTAENVLRQVDCSVLAVKPEGFVTPVKLEGT